jgi:hypothetical protein
MEDIMMLVTVIKEIENSIGSDDFEFVMEDNIMKLEIQNVGIEAVEPFLQLMERHPLVDFGVPGAIVHFVERFYKKGYEELLVKSIKRKPTMHTVWMLNRIINGSENKEDYIELMNDIIDCNDVEDEIRNQARAFVGR